VALPWRARRAATEAATPCGARAATQAVNDMDGEGGWECVALLLARISLLSRPLPSVFSSFERVS
jgi:hypothetical protein